MSLRIIWAVTLVVAIAIPALAQHEVSSKTEMAVGYANLKLPSYVRPLGGEMVVDGRERRSVSLV